jgi:hypothetical protein
MQYPNNIVAAGKVNIDYGDKIISVYNSFGIDYVDIDLMTGVMLVALEANYGVLSGYDSMPAYAVCLTPVNSYGDFSMGYVDETYPEDTQTFLGIYTGIYTYTVEDGLLFTLQPEPFDIVVFDLGALVGSGRIDVTYGSPSISAPGVAAAPPAPHPQPKWRKTHSPVPKDARHVRPASIVRAGKLVRTTMAASTKPASPKK